MSREKRRRGEKEKGKKKVSKRCGRGGRGDARDEVKSEVVACKHVFNRSIHGTQPSVVVDTSDSQTVFHVSE